jgi:hypothetical protein
MMVNNIEIHKTIISMKARLGDLNPKNSIDQKILSRSWKKKIFNDNSISFDCCESFDSICFCHILKRAIPININRSVQTGPKTKFGGERCGFVRVAYQVEILGVVNIEPISPAS